MKDSCHPSCRRLARKGVCTVLESKFSKEMVQQVQLKIIEEIGMSWKKTPLADDETRAAWPGAPSCFSSYDSARAERLQLCRARLTVFPEAAREPGGRLLQQLELGFEAVRYAAMEQTVYQTMLERTDDEKEKLFLSGLQTNAEQKPSGAVRDFDDGLEGMEYLTGERKGNIPEKLRQRISQAYGVDVSPELCAAAKAKPGELEEYRMLFGEYANAGDVKGKFDFWNFLAYGFDKNLEALMGDEKQNLEMIRIDDVSLSECMKGKTENLTDEEEIKLKKLVLCAAVLSKNAKVVCRVPDGMGGVHDVPLRSGDEAQIAPESLDRFLKQFQPCYENQKQKQKDQPELSVGNHVIKHAPEMGR